MIKKNTVVESYVIFNKGRLYKYNPSENKIYNSQNKVFAPSSKNYITIPALKEQAISHQKLQKVNVVYDKKNYICNLVYDAKKHFRYRVLSVFDNAGNIINDFRAQIIEALIYNSVKEERA